MAGGMKKDQIKKMEITPSGFLISDSVCFLNFSVFMGNTCLKVMWLCC